MKIFLMYNLKVLTLHMIENCPNVLKLVFLRQRLKLCPLKNKKKLHRSKEMFLLVVTHF